MFDGHIRGFSFFGGVFPVLIYDNLSTAVQKILRGKDRVLQASYDKFRGYYNFVPRFCNRGQGHEKGGVKGARDYAMVMVMLRCGLRVEELANLTRDAIDLKQKRIVVYNGKGMKDRVALISKDAGRAIFTYLQQRSSSRVSKVFLVEKGTYKDKPISVRGIQKRIEYYAKKSGVKVSCHRLRHTMATQMLNADAKMVTIQDLLGHARIATTERYSKVSNLTVQRDYHKTMDIITTGKSGEATAGGYKKFFTREKQRMVSRHVAKGGHEDHL